PGHETVPREVARLTRPASGDHDAVVAVEHGSLVGVASYERDRDNDIRADFAVFVDDAEHGRGIGTLLLEHLAERARRAGIVELTGDVLAGNAAMLRVATDIAGRFTRRYVDGVVDVALATAA